MAHQHTYDKNGKQLCCTQQEKIYNNAGAAALLKEEHSKDDGHNHEEHGDDDGHDHESSNQTTLQMFLPSIISLFLLLAAIALDNYIKPSWFTGWVRIIWYLAAYAPVGFPVIKVAFVAIGKGRIIKSRTFNRHNRKYRSRTRFISNFAL